MTRNTLSPRVCPDCGSVAIIRLEDMDNCKRCGATRKRMQRLGAAVDRRTPEDRGYSRIVTAGGLGDVGHAYMKRRHLQGSGGG